MTVVDLYTVQIILDEGTHAGFILEDVPIWIEEAEENLTDLLPPGYRARIRRWDHPGNEGDNDE